MTYCLSLLCREGIVCLSDSRTSAGVDNIRIQPKMRIYNNADRVLCLLSSGNLSLTQTAVALIEEDLVKGSTDQGASHLLNQVNMYETARYIGTKIREVDLADRVALEASGLRFNINILVAGQVRGGEHEIYQVYSQGNSIHASMESPFLQIGEFKYGKPILDRGFTYDTSLAEAVKFGLLSLETTMKSNVSVGTPFDIFCYKKDSFEVRDRVRLGDDDPYLKNVRTLWQQGLIDLVKEIPGLDFSTAIARTANEVPVTTA